MNILLMWTVQILKMRSKVTQPLPLKAAKVGLTGQRQKMVSLCLGINY